MFCGGFTATGEIAWSAPTSAGNLDLTGASLHRRNSEPNPGRTTPWPPTASPSSHDMLCATGSPRPARSACRRPHRRAARPERRQPDQPRRDGADRRRPHRRPRSCSAGRVHRDRRDQPGRRPHRRPADLDGASLTNPRRTTALTADGLTVDHDMYCGQVHRDRRGPPARRPHRRAAEPRRRHLTNPAGTALSLDGVNASTLLLLPQAAPDGE